MLKLFTVTCVSASLLCAAAQEKLPREEALKVAFVASVNLDDLLGTPIPTDPDVKRPVVIRDGDYAGMLLPESKLGIQNFTGAGQTPGAVGQLWLRKLVPVSRETPVSAGKLRMIHLKAGTTETDVACCALAVRKGAEKGLDLLVYGKDAEPILTTPLKGISLDQAEVVDVNVERRDDGALVTLRFLGKYEAAFMVTDPDR